MELLYGTRQIERGIDCPNIDVNETADIALENVSVSYSLFETPLSAALPLLPRGVHPSVPALIAATFWSVPGGALGPFEFASLGISCRTGIKPRHLVLAAFIDNEKAGVALTRRYGFPCQSADVKLREYYDRIAGTVSRHNQPILQLETTGATPLVGAGSFVKFSPALNIVRSAGEIHLSQLETTYEFIRVARGVPRLLTLNEDAFAESTPRAVHPVSGAFAVANVTLHAAKFLISPTVPAELGGAARIVRA